MFKPSPSESGAFNPRVCAALILSSFGVLLAMFSFAEPTPPNGTLSPANTQLKFKGSFAFDNQTSTGLADPVCSDATPCDDYKLTADLPADYKTTNPDATIDVTLNFPDGDDFDLFLYDSTGTEIDHSASSDNPEHISISASQGKREFTVRVLSYSGSGDEYTATIDLKAGTAGGPPPPIPAPPDAPGVPRYYDYAAPPAMGETAGEPTIGWNPFTHRAMYISGLQTLRITFPEYLPPAGSIPEPCDAQWEDVSYVLTKTKSLDPILFTDRGTGRTFVSQLNSVAGGPVLVGLNSLMAFTDDDGDNWTPAQINPPDGSSDHQTVGSGPYPASLAALSNQLNKGSAVYYCAQGAVALAITGVAYCSRSDDGGLNFNKSVPIYNDVTDCTQSIHGHVKVAPDGTVYVPNAQCGDRQSAAMSTDGGVTWTVQHVPDSRTGSTDPSVGISKDPPVPGGTSNRIYFAYTGPVPTPTPAEGETPGAPSPDEHAFVAVSDDRGVTWSKSVDIGESLGIKNAVFATAVAGDADRAAVAFIGTRTGGNHQDADFPGTWYGLIAHTYDGGKTWTTVNATPVGPVQRNACIWNQGGNSSCRNLLDFNDINMDDQGHVLFAFADGCVGECESGGPNSYSSKATVARQSGGKGLLAAFDVAEPAVPQRACLSGRRDDQASYLRWVKPDAGGSEITSYQIFRGTSPGNEVLIGQQVGGKNTYTDRSADPAVAKYTYKIVAVNAVGEGQPSNSVELEIAPRLEATGSCSLPGVTVLTDPIGDASDQQQAHDITSVSLAEPDALAGKLVFTIKVVSLSGPVPPNFRYAVRFSAPAPPPDAPGVGAQEDWFVSYVSGAEQFTYGTTGVPQNAARVFTTVGNLDPESHVDPDGTITLVIDKNIIGATAPGDGITNIFGSVRLNGPTGGTNETIPDSTGTSSYQLRPANLCLPNTAPVARLTSDVESGPDPLTVHFDATGSYDVDLIDTIASYTFNFGDGSDDVVQTSDSPTITHTFSQPGEYIVRLVVTDSRGKVSANTDQRKIDVGAEEGSPTPTATPTPTASPGGGDVQLLNISGRLYAQGGDKVGIGGFIVRGTGTKRVILRAMGPSLKVGNQPVPGTLQDPVVELHDNEGGVLVKDNWRDTQEAEIQQTGLAPSDDREAAIVKRLTPGNYTALIRGANDTTGIGLVEIYDLDSSEPIEFGNLSVRSEVGTGDNVLIDGMIIGGTPRRVLFRAIGPSLQNQGVSGALEDPTLELHGGNGELLTSNDNWHDASNAGEIQDTGLAPGDDRESAILETLQPGVYTSIVRGKDNSTGIALAEVYNVP